MKNIIGILLVLITVLAMVGCAKEETPAQTTQATETTQAKEISLDNSTEMLTKYFDSFVQGDCPLYGTWVMEGVEYVSFIFRNDNLAEMAMGTEGNFTSLKIDETNKTLEASFITGINGKYNYALSDDNTKLTLTKDGKNTILNKKENYNFVPKAPDKPVIDEKILGWWKSESGQIYYFGKDGIMYSNNISIETCYTYNIENNKIKAVYDFGGEVTDEIDYEIKNDKLMIKGNEYTPFDPFS